MIIRIKSYGRAGILGNPSDGYFGKTIAMSLLDFPAQVMIYESPEIRIEQNREDNREFANLDAMIRELDHFGYYGGLRLVKATIRQFVRHCQNEGISLPERNFTLRYETSVPQLVGMGGSSAICTATFKALEAFYGVTCRKEIAPTLCWQAEQELGIQCGMQDRVIQIYNGVVFMDFEESYFKEHNHGRYETLAPSLLPNMYIAWAPDRAEFSGIYHHKLLTRRFFYIEHTSNE